MATPADNVVPLTGNSLIDGLTWGAAWDFAGGAHTLTYSLSLNDNPNGGPWTEELSDAVRLALAEWSNVANLSFVETGSGGIYDQSSADLAFILTGDELQSESEELVALGLPPSPSFAETLLASGGATRVDYRQPEGDIAFDNYYSGFSYLYSGGVGLTIMLHEIGHALGLKHTDDGPAGRPTFASLGISNLDSNLYTVMSYTTPYGWQLGVVQDSGNAATPMPLDILAIQQIYGANDTYRTGNDSYSLGSASYLSTIWDAGGNDTIEALTAWTGTTGVKIDLNPGGISGIRENPANGGTSIAYGVIIENAIGSTGSDHIVGNAVANVLSGEGGYDTLEGGVGDDTLIGGLGDDVFVVSDAGDTIVELANQGWDKVQSYATSVALPSNVERLELLGSEDIDGAGNSLSNELTGNFGNNVLDGGGAVDVLKGGAGNDVYHVDNTSPSSYLWLSSETLVAVNHVSDNSYADATLGILLTESNYYPWASSVTIGFYGADNRFDSSLTLTTPGLMHAGTYTVGAGTAPYFAGLRYSVGYTNGNASSGSFTISEFSTNETGVVSFAARFDVQMYSRPFSGEVALNSSLISLTDIVIEGPGAGIDTVIASVSYNMPDNVENLTLTGSANIYGTGSTLANIIVGNSGDNLLTGGLGADTLDGSQGLDTAVYTGLKSAYTVTRVGAGYTVTDTNTADGDEGTDTLSGIEWLQFSDGATKLGRVLADTSGDGKSDLMWRNTDGSTSLWLMNGTSVQTYGSFGQIPTAWQIAASGDLNGDGKTDLMWRNSDGSTSLWLMNGTTVQSYGAFGQIPTPWQITTTGDFNGDGKTDLMWRHTDGSTSLWLMNGTVAQGYGSFGAIPTAWQITASGDFDGDGKTDLMWRHTDGSTSLWLMNGTVAQGFGSFGAIPVTWSILDSQGDYNGDGKNDLLWRNATDGSTNLWLMNGTTVQTYGSFGQVATGWNLVDGHGDYNGDGKSDLMWRHTDGSTSLWLMNGATVQTYGSFGAIPTAWSIVAAHEDYNSDGKSDILWRHTDGSTSLWLMNGTGVQTFGSFGAIPSTWNPVAGADAGATLTGDGSANSLTGTLNNDTLIGLAGNDILSGGAGADRFVFNTALNATTNVDTLTDFRSGTDRILLDHLILTALTTGTLAATSFVAEAGAVAHDGNDYILYDTTTGNLAYDADGTGAQAAVLFATLSGHPTMVAADIGVV